MDTQVLVAYASKYGATREIAERIGDVLRQAGVPVDVTPARSDLDLTRYQAVVLGSAVYVGKWQKEAEGFLKANEKSLAAKPVWIFSSGPTGEGNPVELVGGERVPPALQPIIDRIQPRDVTIFHGNIALDKVNPIEKWAVKSLVKKPFGDYRDWGGITTWAGKIAETLNHGLPV